MLGNLVHMFAIVSMFTKEHLSASVAFATNGFVVAVVVDAANVIVAVVVVAMACPCRSVAHTTNARFPLSHKTQKQSKHQCFSLQFGFGFCILILFCIYFCTLVTE